jgi:hypothetical protein
LRTSGPCLVISIINVYSGFRSSGINLYCSPSIFSSLVSVFSSLLFGVDGIIDFFSSIIDESGLIVVTNIAVG